MKKLILTLSVAIVVLVAFKFQDNKNLATVNQLQGLYIFTDCTPSSSYEYLGTVKRTVGSPQYQSVRDGLIKRAKDEFPEADGIILSFKTGGTDRADVIKFKE